MITGFEQTALSQNVIEGVVFKELKSFADDRGFFRELVRNTDEFFKEGFGQWSQSKMGKNTVKAWHFHHLQVDWWYVPFGVVHTVLIDIREESPTYQKKIEFKLGESELDKEALTTIVRIPQGVAHGCKTLSANAHLFYITSRIYDPQDEGRIPFDTERFGHVWGDKSELTVSENDRREFIPKYERVLSMKSK